MDGVVTLLKPSGMTSSNGVYDVRRIFNEKRAGHLGTLDPGAAGVLPICLGRATRLFDYLVDKEKEYFFEIAFGVATDTQDVYGSVVCRDDKSVTLDALSGVLPEFLGEQMQAASVYSALKVDGKKMCDLVRAGKTVEPKTRKIIIHALELVEQIGDNRFLLRIACSRGTYVRTVCADIGVRLGTCAHMSFLLRTASGPFTVAHAYSVAQLEAHKQAGTLAACVTSCEEALSFLPAVTLPEDRKTPTMNGLDTFVPEVADGPLRVYCGGFLGVGKAEHNRLKLAVHLY